MKRLLRVAACLLLAAAVLAGGAAGLSRLAYGRSLGATLYEWRLRRAYAHPRTAAEEIARLEAKRTAGETPCRLPGDAVTQVGVQETELAGMQTFLLNAPGRADAAVLYLHGGAYISHFNAHMWRFMDHLAAETGCEVVAPAYRLAPFAGPREALEDLAGLVHAYMEAHPGRRLILMGDSAGGGLALALAEFLLQQGNALPERLILFSPWVDVSMENPEIREYVAVDPILDYDLTKVHGACWAGALGVKSWMASPLYGEMAGLPPVTVFCGTRELLYPDILLARDRMAAAGVDVSLHVGRGLNHDYPLMPIPEAGEAMREVVGLIG